MGKVVEGPGSGSMPPPAAALPVVGTAPAGDAFVQNVLVMRHGDRIDHFQALWVAHAERPWDPPLIDEGKVRAWTVGKKLREIGFPLHRVLVSPFLRCRQTAAEVVSALCAVVEDADVLKGMETSQEVTFDPSKVKVSIENGLCEILGSDAIRPEVAPKDGIWFPDVSELESLFPVGTIDPSVTCVYREIPKWQEPIQAARARYVEVIEALAERYPRENLLLVTHGEAVGVSVSAYYDDAQVYDVEYCATSHLQRLIKFDHSSLGHKAEPFTVQLESNAHNGVLLTLERMSSLEGHFYT